MNKLNVYTELVYSYHGVEDQLILCSPDNDSESLRTEGVTSDDGSLVTLST
jgi:hypothetical protein